MFNRYDLQTVKATLAGIVPSDQIYLSDSTGGDKNAFIDIEAGEQAEQAAQALRSTPATTKYNFDQHHGKLIITSEG